MCIGDNRLRRRRGYWKCKGNGADRRGRIVLVLRGRIQQQIGGAVGGKHDETVREDTTGKMETVG